MVFDTIYIGCTPNALAQPRLSALGHTPRKDTAVYTPEEFSLALQEAQQHSRVIMVVGGDADHTAGILTARALALTEPAQGELFPPEAEVYDSGKEDETFAVIDRGEVCYVLLPSAQADVTALCDFLDKKYRTGGKVAADAAWTLEEAAQAAVVNPVRQPAEQLTRENLTAATATAGTAAGIRSNALSAAELGKVAPIPTRTVTAEELTASVGDPEDASVPKETPATVKKPLGQRLRTGKLRTALTASVLAIVLIAALILSYFVIFIPIHADRVYAKARTLYGSAGTASLPKEMLAKFGGLYDVNPDVGGWLILSNTEINYPVMVTKQNDEAFYATHLYNGDKNKYGSIRFDESFRLGEYNRNAVIRGNNLSDGRMFSDLSKYTEALETYCYSPLISMDTVYSSAFWKIFAVYIADEKEDSFDPTRNIFFDDAAFGNYLAAVQDRSLISTAVDVKETDEILTLMTTYAPDSRFSLCVVARKVRALESINVDISGVQINPDPIYPKAWNGQKLTLTPLGEDVKDVFFNLSDIQDTSDQLDIPSTPSSQISVGLDVSSMYGSDVEYYESNFGFNDEPEFEDEEDEEEDEPPAVTSSPSSSQTTTSQVTSSSPASSQTPSQSGSSSQGTSSFETVSQAPNAAACAAPLTVKSSGGTVITGPAVEIVARIIEAEMGSGMELEALKAQAVATYCYLKYHNTSATNPISVPIKSTAGARALEAAQAVVGQVLTYQNKICLTTYYAYSAGRTNACADYWGSNLPYLVSVDSSVDKQYSKFETTKSLSSADMAAKIKSYMGITLSGDPSQWFQITAYNSSGVYVGALNVGGQSTYKSGGKTKAITGSTMRSMLGLRSTAFDIEYDAASDTFTFHVYGYGHGVGLSQRGANYYAKAGYNYQWILAHYYPNTKLGMDPAFS
ncbi:MAG: SpoIID/LytB domain-containing protein [Clostridia bacterium]|nr:SpoIID/LytB domain-containing protein [Clostridia bacterium]